MLLPDVAGLVPFLVLTAAVLLEDARATFGSGIVASDASVLASAM
ncbi:hypothetical protein [Actinomycetospora atypica]|uniref:Uncharacterized protein n=1 Tax=Actinomycetospora atypica TaxID=1290095 RepID=A0ABV9YSN7_9PSEU